MKLEEKYEFRLATIEDIDAIMNFIKTEWNENHILANDRDFFCYQHQMDGRVNFTLAIDRIIGQIEGLEGFIQYSKALLDIAPVMWKVSSSCSTPFLGVEIVKYQKSLTHCRMYGSPGANLNTAVPLAKRMLKHYVGKMDHYYILSPSKDSFKIATVYNRECHSMPITVNAQYKLVLMTSFDALSSQYDFEKDRERIPFKDAWYIERRYFSHPIYRYKVWGIQNTQGQIVGALITREQKYADAKVLRCIDYIGDVGHIAYIGEALLQLLQDGDYEYTDFYCAGIERRIMNDAGFILRDDENINILPNYFEPFVSRNIDIYYHSTHENTLVFKGDGDQDRPNFESSTGTSE